jgi:hypothetical protein
LKEQLLDEEKVTERLEQTSQDGRRLLSFCNKKVKADNDRLRSGMIGKDNAVSRRNKRAELDQMIQMKEKL